MSAATRPLLRAGVAGVVAVLVAVGLSACGKDDANPYGLSDFNGEGAAGNSAPTAGGGTPTGAAGPAAGPSSSSTASSSPAGPPVNLATAPSGAVAYTPSDPFRSGAWVELGQVAAATPARKAVVDAAFQYMTQRVQLSNTWLVDDQKLMAVASGQALASARERAKWQRTAERRSVGRFVLNLSSVRINGDTAVASGCPYDATVEVSDLGSVMSDPAGGVRLTLNLKRTGDAWRVTTFPTEKKFCKEPAR